MRAIMYFVLIVLVLALVGWVSFNRDTQRPGINLETQKMKDDTQKALDSGADLLKKAERSIDGAANPSDNPTDPGPRDAPAPVSDR